MKKLLLKLYYFGNNDKKAIDALQTNIRNIEWEAIAGYIPENSKFLDIGCGAGYSMKLAQTQKKCEVHGIDPDPNAHGVGRNWDNSKDFQSEFNIVKGDATELPYPNNSFDVVYSSHVLEHIRDEAKALREMRRVVKGDGVIIIGVPTASMAIINMISQLLFLSHHRIMNFIFSRLGFSSFPKISFKHLLFLQSHSFPEKTIFYDLKHYRVKNWTKTISKELFHFSVPKEFRIKKTILPAIYPYPDFRQLFKLKKSRKRSSSVFFICKNWNA
jgi:ubiquinone/menaquinone biosynthesis C-methylase UbiE